MASTYQSRDHVGGGSAPFFPSNLESQTSRYGSSSAGPDYNGGFQELSSRAMAHSAPPVRPTENIINRRAGEHSSLYQICMYLRTRLVEVPGFEDHISEMIEEENMASEPTDPVTLMWNCLRRGYPLLTIYNALRPKVPLELDLSRMPMQEAKREAKREAKIGKTATFKFLQACMENLKFQSNECFLITDLYGEDTTGFVKVTKVVNRVLDILSERGLLLRTEQSTIVEPSSAPGGRSKRQHIIGELVRTERDYVEHLDLLQQFKNNIEESGAIAGDAAHDIFLNLNALLDFQRRFLIRIEQQNSLPESEQNWGRIFALYKDSFRVYEPFLANQNRCTAAVMAEWEKIKSAPISNELKGMVETPTILLAFLVKPFQRLTKYPLLLEDLEIKGEYDESHRKDLSEGRAAAKSILDKANEALAKEHRISSVNELQNRVEDWKGHKIDHFGELLQFGTFAVLKGEGAKEVEREVSMIFDCQSMQTRKLLYNSIDEFRCRNPDFTLANFDEDEDEDEDEDVYVDIDVDTRIPRRMSSTLVRVPEETQEGGNDAALVRTPSKRSSVGGDFTHWRTSRSPQNPSPPSPKTASQKALRTLGYESNTPPAESKWETASMHVQKLRRAFSPIKQAFSPRLAACASEDVARLMPQPCLLRTIMMGYERMIYFNGILSHGHPLLFLSTPLPNPIGKPPEDHLPIQLDSSRRPGKILEDNLADEMALSMPTRIQYKVYLFERILLCCKEINPNKPKNKMLGNNKSLVDKKGKPKLQLKGRIFMQNVTDVVTLKKDEKSIYTIQIYWKGDPGVENFVIRFKDEDTMNKWRDTVRMQKKVLSESARTSGNSGTSTTEFISLKNQPKLDNPYRDKEEEDVDDDEGQSSHSLTPGKSVFAMSRNTSSTSLRSGGQPMNHAGRAPPPRFPLAEHNGVFAPSLSLNTNITSQAGSPGEFAANSYFSPLLDSPASTRSSQVSLYPLSSRHQTPGGGWSHEENKHRTAPAMPRAPSREGYGGPGTRPSLPVMGTSQSPQQQLIAQQNRLRSASTPNIHDPNAPGTRRPPNGSVQAQAAAEHVPVPPIPHHMVQPRGLNRSQTASPMEGQIPVRSNTQSPSAQRDRGPRQYQDSLPYDRHGQRLLQSSHDDIRDLNQQSTLTPIYASDGTPIPSQVKVKIWFQSPQGQGHVTIVVNANIKYRSLVDRIDSKLVRIKPYSIANGTARLKYKDDDGDMLNMSSDEEVTDAIDEWATADSNKRLLLENLPPNDLQLWWQEVR